MQASKSTHTSTKKIQVKILRGAWKFPFRKIKQDNPNQFYTSDHRILYSRNRITNVMKKYGPVHKQLKALYQAC